MDNPTNFESSTILLGMQTSLKAMSDNEACTLEMSEKMLSIISSAHTFFSRKPGCRSSSFLDQVEQCAADIWNFAVSKKAIIPTEVNATLRYVACTLIYKFCCSKEDEFDYMKQIMMSLKTARSCLDCHKNEMVMEAINIATESMDKLRLLLLVTNQSGSEESEQELAQKMTSLNRDQLKVLSYKAELLFDTEDGKESFCLLEQARSMLGTLPDEAVNLAALCHKFGVSCYQKRCFEETVMWLKESYDLGKLSNSVSAKSQSSTLRLLAKAYIEWDSQLHWQKALNAVGLANAEHSHPVGLHLKLQILLISGQQDDDQIRRNVDVILDHPDLTLDTAIATLQMICQHNRNEIAMMMVHKLPVKFSAPSNLCRVRVAQLEILLQAQASATDVQQLVQLILKDQNDGQIPEDLISRIQLLLWNHASAATELQQHSDALSWYNLCGQFSSSSDFHDNNMAKLYRNKASCYISLNQLDRAEEEIKSAAQFQPDSPYLYFLKYKISLLKGQEETATESLKKLVNSSQSDDTIGLICLAAQLAYKESRMSVATEAMEGLVACSTDDSQVLTSLRCLTRMKVTSVVNSTSLSSASALEADQQEKDRSLEGKDLKSVISYISTAFDKLASLFRCQSQRNPAIDLDSEANWFMKIAWNMALMRQSAPDEMLELFLLCNKLAALCPKDISNVIRQKRCLLMSACLCLQLAKSSKDERAKRKYLEDVLLYVGESRSFCARAEDLAHSTSDNAAAKETTSLVLLLLYEFEARVRLNDGEAEKIFERAISLPYTDAKTFETMAVLAKQSGRYIGLSMKALKVAVKKYRMAEKIDHVKCSGAMRSLIELALKAGPPTDAASKKDAWNYYLDAMEFINNTGKEAYPEMEIVWLMTKAWNCGIHLYSAGHFQDAMRWCELGVSFLKHLSSLRSSYENQMITAYGEILAKLDSQKTLSSF